jgi:type IV pilus assembly protein PilB
VEVRELGLDPEQVKGVKLARAVGCSACSSTGFKGRCAVYEMLPMTDEIATAIMRGCNTNEIRRMAIEQGMLTLRAAGIRKVLAHMTSVNEILKVSYED